VLKKNLLGELYPKSAMTSQEFSNFNLHQRHMHCQEEKGKGRLSLFILEAVTRPFPLQRNTNLFASCGSREGRCSLACCDSDESQELSRRSNRRRFRPRHTDFCKAPFLFVVEADAFLNYLLLYLQTTGCHLWIEAHTAHALKYIWHPRSHRKHVIECTEQAIGV